MPASTEIRSCETCEEPLRGRIDKRFCSDQCRAQYYNQVHDVELRLIRRINYALRQNRNILRRMVGSFGETPLPRSTLVEAGFRFEFLTQQVHHPQRGTMCLCYDYGYMVGPDDSIMLFFVPEKDQSG